MRERPFHSPLALTSPASDASNPPKREKRRIAASYKCSRLWSLCQPPSPLHFTQLIQKLDRLESLVNEVEYLILAPHIKLVIDELLLSHLSYLSLDLIDCSLTQSSEQSIKPSW